jgi:hypothetical protein
VNSKKTNQSADSFLLKYWWVVPVVIILIAVGVSYFIFASNTQKNSISQKNAELKNCIGTEDESNIDCWYKRYENLVTQKETTKDAFDDVKKAYESSPYVKANCHQIAHIIGRSAGSKFGSVSDAYKQGDSFCWSGYYHGVMEAISAKVGKDEILSKLNDICAEFNQTEQYSFLHYNCVHGLGHGVLQLKNGELFDGLIVCDDLDGTWQQESCQGGVFMENVMNKINPGHTTKYLKNDEPLYPCTAVEDRYKQQCYLMQTSQALMVVNQDFAKVFDLCSNVEQPYNTTCYQSLGRDASGSTSSSIERTTALCNLGEDVEARKNCYIGAVKDFISYFSDIKEAKILCSSANEVEIQISCTETADNYYRSF